MPRKIPLSREEKKIGQRLRAYRESLLISQTNFASKLLLSRAQLINYEDGISPIPWYVAHRAHDRFDLNPGWLITGISPKRLRSSANLPVPDTEAYSMRTPASKVYVEFWQKHVETTILNDATFGFTPGQKIDGVWEESIGLALHGWLQRVPACSVREFYLGLVAEAERLIEKYNPADKGPPI